MQGGCWAATMKGTEVPTSTGTYEEEHSLQCRPRTPDRGAFASRTAMENGTPLSSVGIVVCGLDIITHSTIMGYGQSFPVRD